MEWRSENGEEPMEMIDRQVIRAEDSPKEYDTHGGTGVEDDGQPLSYMADLVLAIILRPPSLSHLGCIRLMTDDPKHQD